MADPVTLIAVAGASYLVEKWLTAPKFRPFGLVIPWGEFDNPLVKPRKGQRIGSLQLQETAEGAPENRCFGRKNRVAGTLVWMSPIKEVKTTESGGKGGTGGEFIVYQYRVSCMIRACRAKTPVSRIPTLWADGKLLFNVDSDINYSSAGIDTKTRTTVIVTGNNPPTFATGYLLVLESDVSISGRPDLSKLKSGAIAKVSGYSGGTTFTDIELIAQPTVGATQVQLRANGGVTRQLVTDDVIEFQGHDQTYTVSGTWNVTTSASGIPVTLKNTITANRPTGSSTTPLPVTSKRGVDENNGSFTVVSASKDPLTQISRVVLKDASNQFRKFAVQAIGPTIAVFQDQAPFKSTNVERVDILTGGPDQAVPTTLQNAESANAAQVYAMRNRAGWLLTSLNMTEYGNRVPNQEGLIEVTPDDGLVADAIKTVLTDDADWPESAIDVSLVSGSFQGYSVQAPEAPVRTLFPLLTAFDVVYWEQNGKLIFASRSAITPTTISVAEIGTYDGEQTRRSLIVRDPPRDVMPSEVVVSYRSPTNDLNVATKPARRTEPVPPNVSTLDLGDLVIPDDFAQQIADKALAVAWGANRFITAQMPMARAGTIRNGMVLTFGPIYGQTWSMFVERVDRGANMQVIASGPEYDANLLIQAATTEGTLGLTTTGNTLDGGHVTQAPLELFLMDAPSLQPAHRRDPGVYVAAHGLDQARAFRGGVLFMSRDSGESWQRVTEIQVEAAAGEVVTAPTVSVLAGPWDRANTIRIRIRHTQVQLGSVSVDACLQGANRFMIGREIIGAADITYVDRDPVDGARTYDLSTLLRGLQGTDDAMDEHVEGDQVVWLDGPQGSINFVPLDLSHVDAPRLWRLVAHGGNLDDAETRRFTAAARNARPPRVRDIRVTRDGSNNITGTFERSTRAARTFLAHGEPLDEESEAYEIDVVNGSGVVKRTLTAGSARTFSYTHANGITDGINTASPVTFRFYQISALLRRGAVSEHDL